MIARFATMTLALFFALSLPLLTGCGPDGDSNGDDPSADASPSNGDAGDMSGSSPDSGLPADDISNPVDPGSLDPETGRLALSGAVDRMTDCEAEYASEMTQSSGDAQWFSQEFNCIFGEAESTADRYIFSVTLSRDRNESSFPTGRYTSAGQKAEWNFASATLRTPGGDPIYGGTSTVVEVVESDESHTVYSVESQMASGDEIVQLAGGVHAVNN